MEIGDTLAEAQRLARSPTWSDRKHAGAVLAGLLEEPEALAGLRVLLLDEDTGVSASTAKALLARREGDAVRLVLEAHRDGGEEHRFHIGIEFASYTGNEQLRSCLNQLASDPRLRTAVADLAGWLGWDR